MRALRPAAKQPSLQWASVGTLASVVVGTMAWDSSDRWGIPAAIIVVASLYIAWVRVPDRRIAPSLIWAAPVPALVVAAGQAGWSYTATAWADLAVLLQLAGNRFSSDSMRLQAKIVSCLGFFVAFHAGLPGLEHWPTLLTILAIDCVFFAAPQDKEPRGRTLVSVLGTLLLTAFLCAEVSGGVLTVAWSFEGLALLAIGFVLAERTLRLQGLTLFGVCILKLFFYDFRNLETVYRILSFVVLGLILLGVSWIYATFREKLKKLL